MKNIGSALMSRATVDVGPTWRQISPSCKPYLISPLPIRRHPHSVPRTVALTESRTPPPHLRCHRHLLLPALWTAAALHPSPTWRRLHRQKKWHHISTSGGSQIHICERRRRASHKRGTSGGEEVVRCWTNPAPLLLRPVASHHRTRIYGPRRGRAHPVVPFKGEPCCCLSQIC
jgi:hypothetical protein